MAAAAVCAPYAPADFDALPMLSGALRSYRDLVEPKGEPLFEALGSLWERHGMLDTFALSLVHRHFEMASNELLVETRESEGVFVSRPVDRDEDVAGKAVAHAWRIGADGRLLPYEFTAEGTVAVDIESIKVAAFGAELTAFLDAAGLRDVFGLTAIKPGDVAASYEVTEGRANIERLLTEDVKANLPPHMSLADAMWRFQQAGKGKPITRACARVCNIHRWTYDHNCVGHNRY